MTRICCACKVEKELSAENFHANRGEPSGFNYACKPCASAKTRRYYLENREGIRLRARRSKKEVDFLAERTAQAEKTYGISAQTMTDLIVHQRGKCAICGKGPGKRWFAVDHDSTTGKVRGLLCDRCNLGIGHFEHSPNMLRVAAHYIESPPIEEMQNAFIVEGQALVKGTIPE